jgi:RNA polymerase sigma factor (sigma-70 family)
LYFSAGWGAPGIGIALCPGVTDNKTTYPVLSETHSEELILRLQKGDGEARARLWTRYLPRLKRWARGRLPPASRDNTSTDDLVQDAFVRSLSALQTMKPRGPRSVFAYFRMIVLNQIRDHARQSARRPRRDIVDWDLHATPSPSPLEEVLGLEALGRYERALCDLSEDDQHLVLAFIELRCTDRELAELFEKPSPAAARMARARALGRLARAMESHA